MPGSHAGVALTGRIDPGTRRGYYQENQDAHRRWILTREPLFDALTSLPAPHQSQHGAPFSTADLDVLRSFIRFPRDTTPLRKDRRE
jgi:hypothetical protein